MIWKCLIGLFLYFQIISCASPPHPGYSSTPKLPENGQNNIWFHHDSSDSLKEKASDTVFIFVHGWNSDSRKAWLSQKGGQYWPEIIKRDQDSFPNVDIFLAGYPTNLNSGAIGLAEASKRLWFAISIEKPDVLRKRNIIFICHSAGGIVTRHMLVHNWKDFVDKKVGLVLIGSPSYGAEAANTFGLVTWIYNNTFARQLAPGSGFLEELDTNFKDLRNGNKIPNLMGVEAIEHYGMFHTSFLPDMGHIVTRDSAGRYFGGLQTMEGTNHQTIVTPQDTAHPSHKLLVRFYKRFVTIPRSSQFNDRVVLNVGISSERPEGLIQALKLYESATNSMYELHGGSLVIHIDSRPNYHDAYAQFKRTNRYDIIMMDDPWVPELASRLTELSKLDAYQSYFRDQKFDDIFLPSLLRSCKANENNPLLYALPVLGNVQMMYAPASQFRSSGMMDTKSWQNSPHAILKHRPLDDYGPPSILARYKTPNDTVSIFWSVLRWLGYENDSKIDDKGSIIVPRVYADEAIQWLRKVHQRNNRNNARTINKDKDEANLGIEGLRQLVETNGLKKDMAFGWPNLISNPQPTRADKNPSIRVFSIGSQPVIGAWVLGIPKSSKNAEEAMRTILALTTNSEFQSYIAEKAGIPTLKDFVPSKELQDKGEFWNENWPAIREALEQGIARPRHPKWHDLEDRLGQQIRRRVLLNRNEPLEDEPGFFRFTNDPNSLVFK